VSLELTRLVAESVALAGGPHPCALLGHVWAFAGGANCGCPDGSCSIPVHRCESCGDYDYGDNDEANDKRARCVELTQ
jgi:hypothetical protein